MQPSSFASVREVSHPTPNPGGALVKSYGANRIINAPPERVWEVLTDGSGFPEWDPGVERVEGSIGAGEKIRVFTKLSPGRAFPVKVSEFVPPRRMTWTGGMPLGLFKGERTFTLEPRADGGTDFSTREIFSGPLLPVIGRTIPDLGPSFEQFADGLKKRSERVGV
jgi:hypothetical protein